ncbi:MAG: carbohydrate kinase, partial [Lachnospiraceae bacterium]|nr:carbohydrate kinase [Lachnospiraceae bacterium]
DMHGKFLKKTLEDEGIDVRAVIEDENYFTTLAFVEIEESGERHFSFARKPGADTKLQKEELDEKLLSDCKIFHFGSLSLTEDPSNTATYEALRIAKEAGAFVSYDPNYRASLWKNPKVAVKEMKKAISYADMMKVSDEESLMLTGCNTYEDAADVILDMGVRLVAITLGKDGVLLARKDKKEVVSGFKVFAVDTTGAGDSFWGGFLSKFLSFGKDIEDLEWENIKKCGKFGNAVAALCVQKRGGIPSIPEKNEVLKFLQKNC